MALAPIVNSITPFLNASYASVWTPDILWRLVLYWHGGIFIPWITALAAVAVLTLHLDKAQGTLGRLLKESILWGGLFVVPLAGIAGIFDVYDTYLLGIPLWLQIFAFLIGDEMAIALLVTMVLNPRRAGPGTAGVGLPYFAVLGAVFATLVAALMGHMSGWITFFGPTPAIYSQYINSTMYPVLGYSNSTAVMFFTEDAVGSHSHLMIPALMMGVVALSALVYGYREKWSAREKTLANFGFVVMLAALAGTILMYVVAGVGNYVIPTLFMSGPGGANGIAADDLLTGIVGLGGVFVLMSLLSHSFKKSSNPGSSLIRDPLFLTVMASWLFIYLLIPAIGYYIELNHGYYLGAGSAFDQAYTRFHQDFGFFLLPALVTAVLGLEGFGISGKKRRMVGGVLLIGIIVAFFAGLLYAMVNLSPIALYGATLGGALIGVGVLLGADFLRRKTPETVQFRV
jgi:hypothetical protein